MAIIFCAILEGIVDIRGNLAILEIKSGGEFEGGVGLVVGYRRS